MPLTEPQRQAIQSLEWLYDNTQLYRRSGRTLAQIIALVRIAARTPGTTLTALDHSGLESGQRYLVNNLRTLVHQDHRLEPYFRMIYRSHQEATFSFDSEMPPIPDWWPPEEVLAGLMPLPFSVDEQALQSSLEAIQQAVKAQHLKEFFHEKEVVLDKRPTLMQHLLSD